MVTKQEVLVMRRAGLEVGAPASLCSILPNCAVVFTPAASPHAKEEQAELSGWPGNLDGANVLACVKAS